MHDAVRLCDRSFRRSYVPGMIFFMFCANNYVQGHRTYQPVGYPLLVVRVTAHPSFMSCEYHFHFLRCKRKIWAGEEPGNRKTIILLYAHRCDITNHLCVDIECCAHKTKSHLRARICVTEYRICVVVNWNL